jgi:uncharacterized protein YggU (UPF0235/DUF167 family)
MNSASPQLLQSAQAINRRKIMVYLAVKNGQVIHRTNAGTMRQWDGVEPEHEVTDAEYLASSEIARFIDGEFFLGLTPEEEEEREELLRIAACEAELARIDQDAMAGRAIRELVLELAERAGLQSNAVEILQGYEAKAEPLRAELRPLLASRDKALASAS